MIKDHIGFSLKEIFIIILITAVTTSLTTGIIMYNNNKLDHGSINLNTDEDLKEFLKVYSSLNNDYYEDINKKAMLDTAIKAMLNYLGEDYSTYMDETETNILTNQLSGTYKGIGVSIINNNHIYKVYDGTPAAEAGLKENDIIIKINEEEVTEETSNVPTLLKKNSENKITVNRDGEILEFQVTTKEINTPLTREVKEAGEHKVGYIYFSSFTNTASVEFKKALEELESEQIDSLIIDMRNNSGGLLSAATEIASMFLEEGKEIFSLEGKDTKEVYTDTTSEKREYPIVVIMNGASASASEVLAAALKESYGATIVGGVSYGKGKVQQTKNLEDGSMVKYTTARWFTPSGECIDGMGIYPDYSVELIPDEEGNYVEDTQLNKALELLQ